MRSHKVWEARGRTLAGYLAGKGKGALKEEMNFFCSNFSERQLNYCDASGPSGSIKLYRKRITLE